MVKPLPAIISPKELFQQLEANANDLLLIDLCQLSDGHIACIEGAAHVDASELLYGEKPVTGLLPPKNHLQALFRRLGLTEDKQVVVYDNVQSTWAARMAWTLDVIGFHQVTLLDGGLQQWQKEGLPVVSKYLEPTPSDIDVYLELSMVADKDYILKAISQNQLTVWDARSEDEYCGAKAFSKRAGHIPGAKHYEWKNLLDDDGLVRDLPAIKDELEALGITADKEVITHCQTHRRSALTYFVAKKLLNYNNIKAYPGSWSEWGNADETPVAS